MADYTSPPPIDRATNPNRHPITLAMTLTCVDDFYARMFRDWRDAITQHTNGYTLSYSGNVYLTGANHIWSHHLAAFTPAILNEADRFFATYNAAWSAICAEPIMDDTITGLYSRGFSLRWDSPIMVLDTAPCPCPIAKRTSVVQAHNRQQLYDLTRVLSEAFSTGPSVNRRVIRPEHLNDPTMRHYLIYHGVHPATAATVMLHNLPTPNGNRRIASIWNVGTRPRFRRRRYAATIMQALLADLYADGITASMLLASTSGYPLYERLGYQTLGRLSYLAPPR